MKISSLEILEKSDLRPVQAKAILKGMELETDAAHEDLVTKADLRSEIARLDAKFGELEGRLTRWIFTCILGQTAVLAGFGYFLAGYLRR